LDRGLSWRGNIRFEVYSMYARGVYFRYGF
jgi:hypothetical protein